MRRETAMGALQSFGFETPAAPLTAEPHWPIGESGRNGPACGLSSSVPSSARTGPTRKSSDVLISSSQHLFAGAGLPLAAHVAPAAGGVVAARHHGKSQMRPLPHHGPEHRRAAARRTPRHGHGHDHGHDHETVETVQTYRTTAGPFMTALTGGLQ